MKAHAKGVLLNGSFTPTPEAASLSRAQHFTSASTPVIARFSSSTGIPNIPDTDANGNPRGLALRFTLATTPRRVHTDIVAHSTPFFPAPDGPSALEFFRSLVDGTVGAYLGSHPAALAFVQAPKPTPSSFAHEQFYSVSAFKLVNAAGKATFVRYRIVPVAGQEHLDAAALEGKDANFLFDAVPMLLAEGPIQFKLVVQVAKDGDVTDDNTVHWPEDRELVDLGTVSLTGVAPENAEEQKKIIFDPVPRVDGVEPSGDPLLDVRAGVYLLSGRERRAA